MIIPIKAGKYESFEFKKPILLKSDENPHKIPEKTLNFIEFITVKMGLVIFFWFIVRNIRISI